MDFSYLLINAVPDFNKLLDYGFSEQNGILSLKKEIPGTDFYGLIIISLKNTEGKLSSEMEKEFISAEVYETETNEKYALLDVKSAKGAFVGMLRDKVNSIMNEILSTCFYIEDLKDRFVRWLKEEVRVGEDFPWNDSASVYRCENQKWFALVMEVKYKSLGLESDSTVWCVNLKADPLVIPSLIDNKSIFPAYHMSKKHWITVMLTAVTDFEKLKELTVESKNLVEDKKKHTVSKEAVCLNNLDE